MVFTSRCTVVGIYCTNYQLTILVKVKLLINTEWFIIIQTDLMNVFAISKIVAVIRCKCHVWGHIGTSASNKHFLFLCTYENDVINTCSLLLGFLSWRCLVKDQKSIFASVWLRITAALFIAIQGYKTSLLSLFLVLYNLIATHIAVITVVCITDYNSFY